MSETVFIQINDEMIEANGETLEYIESWRAETSEPFTQSPEEHQAKIDARKSALAKLAALGLTEEEIAAL